MKQTHHYIIRFDDLSTEKQTEIRNDLENRLRNETDRINEIVGADPFDIDKPNTDYIAETIKGVVERAISRFWTEIEMETNL